MYLPSWRWALNALAVLGVGLFVGMFVTTRLVLFSEAYSTATAERTSHERFAQLCLTHVDLRETEPVRCQERIKLASQSPWSLALKHVVAETHSCGQWPCTTLYGVVLDKTSGTLLQLTLGVSASVLLYALLLRVVGPLIKSATLDNSLAAQHVPSVEGGYARYALPSPIMYDDDSFVSGANHQVVRRKYYSHPTHPQLSLTGRVFADELSN